MGGKVGRSKGSSQFSKATPNESTESTRLDQAGSEVPNAAQADSVSETRGLGHSNDSKSSQTDVIRESDKPSHVDNTGKNVLIEIFDQEKDEEEVLESTFKNISRGNICISRDDLEVSKAKFSDDIGLGDVLNALMSEALEGKEIDLLAFKKAVDPLPRVRGQRVQWANSLGLDGELARLIPVGTILDGLKALTEISDEHLEQICVIFSEIVRVRLRQACEKLKTRELSVSRAEEANSKYCLTDGAFKGTFGSLDDFYMGPEAKIGYPNPNLFEGMHREHCLRSNAKRLITTPNYNVTTCSDWEWRFVVCPDDLPQAGFEFPHTPAVQDRSEWSGLDAAGKEKSLWKGHGRNVQRLDELMGLAAFKEKVHIAKLGRDEIIALRLYTGPLYILYNAVLRGYPQQTVESLDGNRYETTLFVIISGVSKLSRVTAVPPNRLLYRGLGGMLLPDQFWKDTGQGFLGGVELGLMSTTSDRRIAIQYSGQERRRAAIMEISAGRIDIGGSLGFLSQYPGEEEFLMPPLSCLEVVGRPRVELTSGGELIVFPLRVNVNLKSVTVEELTGRRKALHLAMAKNLREELVQQARAGIEQYISQELARAAGACAELVRGDPSHVRMDPAASAATMLKRSAATFGAPCLAASAGKVRFEVTVTGLRGALHVGFAGTNFRPVLVGGKDPPPPHLGDDTISWHVHNFEGDGRHGGAYYGNTGRMWMLSDGDVVGLAADLATGVLLVGSEHGWRRTPLRGITPGAVVGSGVYPAWTVEGGTGCVAYNFGARPFKLPAPAPDFLAIADAAAESQVPESRAATAAGAAAREGEARLAQCRLRHAEATEALIGHGRRLLRQLGGPPGSVLLQRPWSADFKEICVVLPWVGGRSAGQIYFEVEIRGLAASESFLVVGLGGSKFLAAAAAEEERAGPQFDESFWGVGCAAGFGCFRAHAMSGGKPEKWGDGTWKAGDVVGLACDLDAGRMMVSLNGDFSSPFGVVFEGGVTPGGTDVGPSLYPIVCGRLVHVGLAFGAGGEEDALRFAPPDPAYLSEPAAGSPGQLAQAEVAVAAALADLCAAEAEAGAARAAQTAAEEVLERVAEAALQRSGVTNGVAEAEFEHTLTRHINLAAAAFNDDHAYKRLLNEVLDLKGHLLNRQAAVLALKRAGASEAALLRCATWSATEFRGGEAALPEGCGYTWQSLLAGWSAEGMRIPLELSPCLLAMVWEAVLRAGVAEVRLGVGVGTSQPLRMASLLPLLAVVPVGLHHVKYAGAIVGLVVAAAGSLTGVDVRGNEYPAKAVLQLSAAVANDSAIITLNGQSLPEAADRRKNVCRAIAAGCGPASSDSGFRGLAVDLERAGRRGGAGRRRSGEEEEEEDWSGVGPALKLEDIVYRRASRRRAVAGRGVDQSAGEEGSDDDYARDEDVRTSELDAAEWAFLVARLDAIGVRWMRLEESWLEAKGALQLAGPLGSLNRLADLRLGSNGLHDEGAAAIALSLSGLTGLRALFAPRNDIGVHGCMALARGLVGLTALRALDLSHNPLQKEGASALAKALEGLVELECLCLLEADLGAGGGHAIAEWLGRAAATGLRKLELGGNDLGADACKVAASALSRFGALQRLGLSGNNAGEEAGVALGQAVARLTVLAVLDLCENDLGANACAAVAESLPMLTGLRELRLADTRLRAADWAPVAASLRGLTRLARLDGTRIAELDKLTHLPGALSALVAGGHSALSFGYMFNKPELDAAALGALLACSAATLVRLDLSYSDLGRPGRALAIGRGGLDALTALQVLSLASNFLGRAGAAGISGALKPLGCLTSLDLSDNRLGDGGAEALAEALAALAALRTLDLRNNELGPVGCVCAAAAAGRLTALESLDLSGNRLAASAARRRGSISDSDDENDRQPGSGAQDQHTVAAETLVRQLAEALSGAKALRSVNLGRGGLSGPAEQALSAAAGAAGLPLNADC